MRHMQYSILIAALALTIHAGAAAPTVGRAQIEALKNEVRHKGWIVFNAYDEKSKSWDIFASRPDGSDCRNLTTTPQFQEAAPRVSPDGKKIIYRRLRATEKINHNAWGMQGEPAIMNSDGSNPKVIGSAGSLQWATWAGSDDRIAFIDGKEIKVMDLNTSTTVSRVPRRTMYWLGGCSPDGKAYVGVANFKGDVWTVARLSAETGEINKINSFQNCTPDWFPDSRHVIFSSRPAGQPGGKGYGYTQLWMADANGTGQHLVYGEDGMHLYGGSLSPDGKYLICTRSPVDGGGSTAKGAPICILRMADTPAISGESPDLRKVHPNGKTSPVLTLMKGWEPCWTYHELFAASTR